MKVHRARSLIVRNDLAAVWHGGQQALERHRHFKHDLRTHPGQHRNVTTELDGVTQPLLGPDQDPPPGRSLQGWQRRDVAMQSRVMIDALPAIFVLLPACFKVLMGEPDQRLVPVGLGLGRNCAQGLVVTCHRLVIALEFRKRHALVG